MLGAAGGVALLLLIVGWLVLSSMSGGKEAESANVEVAPVAPQPVPVVTPDDAGVAKKDADGPSAMTDSMVVGAIVEDDGELLWASPTQGQPIEFKYVPNGARLYLVLRPAEMLSKPEGERVLKALGPDCEATRAAWESAAGVALSDVERLTIAAYPNNGQAPKYCSVVQLRTASGQEALLSKWGNPTAVPELSSVFQKGELAYYIPSDGNGQTFVMGSLEPEIRDVATGTPLLMQRELGRLLQASDADRHVTILFAQDFFRGGNEKPVVHRRQERGTRSNWSGSLAPG